MKYDDFHTSRFVGVSDLGGNSHIVQIARIEREQLSDGKVKPAMYFVDRQKALLVNQTNWRTLGAAFGQDLNSWIGRSIELFAMPCQGPNGMTQGVRVRSVTQPLPAQATPPSAPTAPTNQVTAPQF